MAYTYSSSISEIMSDPCFGNFGRLLLPIQQEHLFGDTLEELRMTFYNCINPTDTVSVINYLKSLADNENRIFYDIYTDQEKNLDPEKKDTGLFFFRGEPDKPFAVTCAGGGFQFVGAIHGSFPLSLKLAQKGYNAFALIYRPDAVKSCEDLAKAVEFIFEHASELNVSTEGYSIWGESAGARMAAFIGSYGTERFGCKPLPRPSAVIMQYTGHSDFADNDPPTYMNAGGNDVWHLDMVMEKRYLAMKQAGIPVEFRRYEGLPHGYGLGIGTIAEGWHKEALAFWEEHR